jgi:signal transduction histidine kinase
VNSAAHGAAPDASIGARRATLIVAAGLAAWAASVVAIHWRRWFYFEYLGTVLAIIGAMVLFSLSLAATARLWASRRWAVYVYEAVLIAGGTAAVHFLGGIPMGILFIGYAFPIMVTQMLRPDASVFVTANLCALCYAGMALAEVWWPPPATLTILASTSGNPPVEYMSLIPDQTKAFVLFGVLALNTMALYAVRYSRQLHANQDLRARTRALAEHQRALQERQEEIRAFAHVVSHDIKNPINAVLLTSDLLLQREGASLSERGRADLETIARLAGHTEEMIRDLLALFKIISAGEAFGPVDLNALVAQALESLGPEINAKNVRVEVGQLAPAWGQSSKLFHLVLNLLGNAVKYVKAGRGAIRISSESENGTTLLCISDNGIGIPKAYHAMIFELFGRVPAREQVVDGVAPTGTGMGLALVKRIAEVHGGRVWVESEPGSGSRFHVSLPACEPISAGDLVMVAPGDAPHPVNRG